MYGEVGEELLPQEPALASICRSVPSDRPYRAPGPRDFQLSSQNLGRRKTTYRTHLTANCLRAQCLCFPLLDPEKLPEEQRAEFGRYIDYVKAPVTAVTAVTAVTTVTAVSAVTAVTATVPDGANKSSTSHYFLNENALFRNLRKRGSFRDRLILPTTTLRKLVVHSCHDLPASGGHLAFKATLDKIRDRHWWRTISEDVANHNKCCSSCQHRKTSHRCPKLPVGHRLPFAVSFNAWLLI